MRRIWPEHGVKPSEPAWVSHRSAIERSGLTHLKDDSKLASAEHGLSPGAATPSLDRKPAMSGAPGGSGDEYQSRAESNPGSYNPTFASREGLREQEALANGPASPKSTGGGTTGSKQSTEGSGAGAASPEQLKQEEAVPSNLDEFESRLRDNFYNPDGSHKKLSIRKKAMIIGSITGIVGGGGLFGFASIAAGPLQFIHLAQMLSSFHLDKHDAQQKHRMGKIFQYFKGESEKQKNMPITQQNRSRLTVLGRVFSGRFEQKLNKAGFKAVLGGDGKFLHWRIDAKIAMPDKDLKAMTPEEIRGDLKGRLGIDMDAGGGDDGIYTVSPEGNKLGYYNGSRFTYSMARIAGYSKIIGGLHARHTGKIAGIVGWHPMQKVTEKFKGKVTTPMAKKFKEVVRKAVKGNFDVKKIITRGGENGGSRDIGELASQGAQTDPDKPESVKGITDTISGRVSPLATWDPAKLVGNALLVTNPLNAVCFIYNVLHAWTKIKWAFLAMPMMSMFAHDVAFGMEMMDNDNPKSDTPEVNLADVTQMASLLHDDKTGSTWSDATSIQSMTGSNRSVGGADDLPDIYKPGPSDSTIIKAANNVGVQEGLGSVCDFIGSVAGTIVIETAHILATVFSGGTEAVAGSAGLRLAGSALAKFVIKLALKKAVVAGAKDTDVYKSFVKGVVGFISNLTVDAMQKGSRRGNYLNYGAKLFGNAGAISNGGNAMTQPQTAALDQMQEQIQNEEFQKKSFASRMFDTTDYRSGISRLIDGQAASPRAEFARMGKGILNLGNTMAGMPMRLVTSVTHAAPAAPAYDYSFGDYDYTIKDMDTPELDDPFENAQAVHDIMTPDGDNEDLDGAPAGNMTRQDTYVQRAKYCYGKTINKPSGPDDTLTVADDANGPPDYDTIANYPQSVELKGVNVLSWMVPQSILNPLDLINDTNSLAMATVYATGTDSVGDGTCNDDSLEWKRIRMFLMDTNTMNTMACAETKDSDAKSKKEPEKLMAKEGEQACKDTGYGNDCGSTGASAAAAPAAATGDAPMGQVFYDGSNPRLDTDGKNPPPIADGTRQSETSFQPTLDATNTPYVVVDTRDQLGKAYVVKDINTNKSVVAIGGDIGHGFGEISYAAAQALGMNITRDAMPAHHIIIAATTAPPPPTDGTPVAATPAAAAATPAASGGGGSCSSGGAGAGCGPAAAGATAAATPAAPAAAPAAAAPAAAPAAGGGGVWKDAPDGNIGGPFSANFDDEGGGALSDGTATIVADSVKGKALDFHATGGSTGDHQRVELVPAGPNQAASVPHPGQDIFVGFDLMFPQDPPMVDQWQEVMQLKGAGGAGNPTFEFDVNYGEPGMFIAHNSTEGVTKTPAGKVPAAGQWTRFIVGFHVTTGPDSNVTVWQDGVNVADKVPWAAKDNTGESSGQGGLLYGGDTEGYFKIGMYRGATGADLHFLYANMAIGPNCAAVSTDGSASTTTAAPAAAPAPAAYDRKLRTSIYV